jgi:nucleoside-diphosphate-sugar epimerase
MRILLTGGSGFIATSLIKKLENNELEIFDLVNGKNIEIIKQLDEVFNAFKPDIVINLSAKAGVRVGEEQKNQFYLTNCLGTQNIVEMCEKYKVKQLIHLSSSSAINPVSWYGMTKLFSEYIVKRSFINWTIIRPFTVIGYNEKMREEMVIKKWFNNKDNIPFIGDGTTKRGYTFIDDFCEAVILMIGNKKAYKKLFEIGGQEEVSLNEMFNIFKSIFPEAKKNMLGNNPFELKSNKADIREAKKLGWKPKAKIKKEIKKIWEKLKS